MASQRSEGWVLVRDHYDDGGISGGTLDRPALTRLLRDIEEGLVDVVVVYKIDRLSRSLMDFAKLVEVFDRNEVTFVSVTQSFNTTTSMGRLTLNILLSFAQFEREVTAERIRDKFRASRMKGIWMGGNPPYGYRVEDRKLVIDEDIASHVRWIFTRFIEVGSATILAREAARTRFPDATRQPHHQEFPLPDAEQPRLPRRGRAQGHELSRRAQGPDRPRDFGTRSMPSCRKAPASVRPGPAPEHRPCSRGYSTVLMVPPSRPPILGKATGSTATMSARRS